MKRYRWLFPGLCLLLLLCAPAAWAQSYSLSSLAEQLVTQSEDLAERSYRDYSNAGYRNRNDVETLYLAQQFSASASIFRRMVRDSRRESELKDAANVLTDMVRRAGGNYSQRSQWNDVQRTLEGILRELNVGGRPGGGFPPGGGGGGGRNDDNPRATGRLRWRGIVDDDVQLVISESNVQVRTLGGNEYNNAVYNFTSPLPRRRVTVSVNRLKGRGDVEVIQQPSRDNNFTAVVQIRDPKGGARDYDIEVMW